MQKKLISWHSTISRPNLYIINHLGKNIYSSFFEPLLKSKFGEHRNEVSAAWLISRIAIRSNRGVAGERLGYLNGGFHILIDALERSIESKAGHVYKQSQGCSG